MQPTILKGVLGFFTAALAFGALSGCGDDDPPPRSSAHVEECEPANACSCGPGTERATACSCTGGSNCEIAGSNIEFQCDGNAACGMTCGANCLITCPGTTSCTVTTGNDGEIRGRENVKAYLQTFMTALPDIKLTVEDIFGEGDRIFSRARLQGTNTGEFNGMPPTGRSIDISWIMNACRVQDGRIVEEWEILDQLELVRQLGLVDAPLLAEKAEQAGGAGD